MHKLKLNPEQKNIVGLPPSQSVLITGEAGVGKTHVALCRLAALTRRSPGLRSAVLVPNSALVDKTDRQLRRLGVDAEVSTFDDWSHRQAMAVFDGVPERLSVGASAGVIAFKRHPAVRAALDDVQAPDGVCADTLFELWGDSGLLEAIVDEGADPLQAEAVANHARVQFQATALATYGEDGRGFDGESIDFGTPDEDAGSLDLEDFPVLFALAPRARIQRYDHIVVDESQALAPMEYALIARAVTRSGSITVAGDAHQASDPTAYFLGWKGVIGEFSPVPFAHMALERNHRCPLPIIRFARSLFSGADWSESDALRLTLVPEGNNLLGRLRADLADAPADTTVIARTAERARRLRKKLGPGHHITHVDGVRGLDLTHVVVPDAGPAAYPAGDGSREALYIAVTRATRSVRLYAAEVWSPLIG